MNFLLDTHIALWYLSGDSKLSKKAKSYIDDGKNSIYFSVASMWEIEIKHILHPDKMISSGNDFLLNCENAAFSFLPLHPDHINLLHTLKRSKKEQPHNDPFDRILISQAKSEKMILLTHDTLLSGYKEKCVEVL